MFTSPALPFQDVTHIIVVCIYTEPIEKVAETLDTLASQMEVSKQMCICMATEARDQNGLRTAKELRYKLQAVATHCSSCSQPGGGLGLAFTASS
jgi:hypothetical protein